MDKGKPASEERSRPKSANKSHTSGSQEVAANERGSDWCVMARKVDPGPDALARMFVSPLQCKQLISLGRRSKWGSMGSIIASISSSLSSSSSDIWEWWHGQAYN